jgi:hypothetical protein
MKNESIYETREMVKKGITKIVHTKSLKKCSFPDSFMPGLLKFSIVKWWNKSSLDYRWHHLDVSVKYKNQNTCVRKQGLLSTMAAFILLVDTRDVTHWFVVSTVSSGLEDKYVLAEGSIWRIETRLCNSCHQKNVLIYKRTYVIAKYSFHLKYKHVILDSWNLSFVTWTLYNDNLINDHPDACISSDIRSGLGLTYVRWVKVSCFCTARNLLEWFLASYMYNGKH